MMKNKKKLDALERFAFSLDMYNKKGEERE